jgi:hypothetical protein
LHAREKVVGGLLICLFDVGLEAQIPLLCMHITNTMNGMK